MNVVPVPSACVGEFWGEAENHLRRIEGLNLDYMRGCCERAEFQLWLAMDRGECVAALLTEVTTAPERVVTITNAAGNRMADWFSEAVQVIDGWRETMTDRPLRVVGRHGWARKLRGLGFDRVAVVLEKKSNV